VSAAAAKQLTTYVLYLFCTAHIIHEVHVYIFFAQGTTDSPTVANGEVSAAAVHLLTQPVGWPTTHKNSMHMLMCLHQRSRTLQVQEQMLQDLIAMQVPADEAYHQLVHLGPMTASWQVHSQPQRQVGKH
jgi:hypothetical protein